MNMINEHCYCSQKEYIIFAVQILPWNSKHAWVVCEASWKGLVLENVRQQVENLTRWQGGAKKGNLDGKAGGKPK